VGPMSTSICDVQEDIGDDYTFSNIGAGNDYMQIDHFRWIGAGNGGRVAIEFYDASGNFIEDTITQFGVGGTGIYVQRFDPPITIPPTGYVVIRPATPQFSPNGRTYWAMTDATDAGTNDGNKLWIDGAVVIGAYLQECVGGTNDGAWCDPDDPGGSECTSVGGVCTARSSILAFELEGEKTSSPVGACCDMATGACDGNLPWLCTKAMDKTFHGVGSLCASCVGGTNPGANCQRCSGGSNAGAVCDQDSDCPGGTCALFPGDCSGGTCTPIAICNAGACCNPTTGACTETTEAACVGGGGTFQGFGTACDADTGRDVAVQSCCPQPTVTGADGCEGVSVIATPPLAPFDDPYTATFTGDNTTAGTIPETCNQGAWNPVSGDPLIVDPGWWEAFSIQQCSYVRVDFCCSDPVLIPQWAFLWKGCPCADTVPQITTEDANLVLGDLPYARGAPYCDEDNLWMWYGPLAAGTYYIPI